MKKGLFVAVMLLLALVLGATEDPMAAVNQRCLVCHQDYKDMQNIVAGEFKSRSQKAGTITVDAGASMEVLKISDDIKIKNLTHLNELKESIPVLVRYQKKGEELIGVELIAKPKFEVPENQLMKLDDLKALVQKGPETGNYLLVDSRPANLFEAGHIPTAINIPFPKMKEMLGLLPKEKDKLVIFYCQGVRCVLSPMAAKLAAKEGYTNVKVFHEGLPVWQEAGLPIIVKPEFVRKTLGYLVLIDTRGVEAAKAGHIQGAVAISLEEIPKEKTQFPLDKKAHIIFYGEDTSLAKLSPIIKEVSSWGYSNLGILEGGYKEWVKNSGPIQKDLVQTKIFYIPRPKPGEITGDEFMNIAKTKPQDKIVLDVRSKQEAAAGMIEGAINIPLDELQTRLKELPKDKEIIIHCSTGLRAEMAYNIVRNAGLNARFLNDKVAVLEKKLICCFKE